MEINLSVPSQIGSTKRDYKAEKRRLIHDANAALTSIDATFTLLGGTTHPRAFDLYKKSHSRMRSLISGLMDDELLMPQCQESSYDAVVERIYTSNHPSVIQQTKFFEGKMASRRIFETFDAQHPKPSITKAKVVGVSWHQFSEFMPWFLCRAASKVTTNEMRHYVIQTAFEELGMRECVKIHADMFWKSASIAGITEEDRLIYRKDSQVNDTLTFLSSEIEKYTDDAQILGILLGLEIPAKENIESIFKSLCYDDKMSSELEKSEFFQIHRKIEIEHVRLTVANFLRFCTNEHQKVNFNIGFNAGLNFWEQFWKCVAIKISNIQVTRQQRC